MEELEKALRSGDPRKIFQLAANAALTSPAVSPAPVRAGPFGSVVHPELVPARGGSASGGEGQTVPLAAAGAEEGEFSPETARIALVEDSRALGNRLVRVVWETISQSTHPLAGKISKGQVRLFDNGKTAMEWIRQEKPQLVITDNNLLDGRRGTAIVQTAREANSKVAIVWVSGGSASDQGLEVEEDIGGLWEDEDILRIVQKYILDRLAAGVEESHFENILNSAPNIRPIPGRLGNYPDETGYHLSYRTRDEFFHLSTHRLEVRDAAHSPYELSIYASGPPATKTFFSVDEKVAEAGTSRSLSIRWGDRLLSNELQVEGEIRWEDSQVDQPFVRGIRYEFLPRKILTLILDPRVGVIDRQPPPFLASGKGGIARIVRVRLEIQSTPLPQATAAGAEEPWKTKANRLEDIIGLVVDLMRDDNQNVTEALVQAFEMFKPYFQKQSAAKAKEFIKDWSDLVYIVAEHRSSKPEQVIEWLDEQELDVEKEFELTAKLFIANGATKRFIQLPAPTSMNSFPLVVDLEAATAHLSDAHKDLAAGLARPNLEAVVLRMAEAIGYPHKLTSSAEEGEPITDSTVLEAGIRMVEIATGDYYEVLIGYRANGSAGIWRVGPVLSSSVSNAPISDKSREELKAGFRLIAAAGMEETQPITDETRLVYGDLLIKKETGESYFVLYATRDGLDIRLVRPGFVRPYVEDTVFLTHLESVKKNFVRRITAAGVEEAEQEIRNLQNADSDVRREAAFQLISIAWRHSQSGADPLALAGAVGPLAVAMEKDSDAETRRAAALALGEIGWAYAQSGADPLALAGAVGPLAVAVEKDGKGNVRMSAANALGRVSRAYAQPGSDPAVLARAVGPLAVAMEKDSYADARISAAYALGEIGWAYAQSGADSAVLAGAVGPLTMAMEKDSDKYVKSQAAVTLLSLDQLGITVLSMETRSKAEKSRDGLDLAAGAEQGWIEITGDNLKSVIYHADPPHVIYRPSDKRPLYWLGSFAAGSDGRVSVYKNNAPEGSPEPKWSSEMERIPLSQVLGGLYRDRTVKVVSTEESVAPLVQQLQSGSDQERARAAEALGKPRLYRAAPEGEIRDSDLDQGFSALIQALGDLSPEVRRRSAESLAEIPHKQTRLAQASHPLLDAIGRESDVNAKISMIYSVIYLDRVVSSDNSDLIVEMIRGFLRDLNVKIRMAAAIAFGQYFLPTAAGELAEAFQKESDQRVRRELALSYLRVGGDPKKISGTAPLTIGAQSGLKELSVVSPIVDMPHVPWLQSSGPSIWFNAEEPTLPVRGTEDEPKWAAIGVALGESVKEGSLFRHVVLPAGWQVVPTNHIYWSYLVDDKGLARASIFVKDVLYERRAWVFLIEEKPAAGVEQGEPITDSTVLRAGVRMVEIATGDYYEVLIGYRANGSASIRRVGPVLSSSVSNAPISDKSREELIAEFRLIPAAGSEQDEIGTWIASLKSDNPETRVKAARVLGDRLASQRDLSKARIEEGVNALMVALREDTVPSVRQMAEGSLDRIQRAQGIRIFENPANAEGLSFYIKTIDELSRLDESSAGAEEKTVEGFIEVAIGNTRPELLATLKPHLSSLPTASLGDVKKMIRAHVPRKRLDRAAGDVLQAIQEGRMRWGQYQEEEKERKQREVVGEEWRGEISQLGTLSELVFKFVEAGSDLAQSLLYALESGREFMQSQSPKDLPVYLQNWADFVYILTEKRGTPAEAETRIKGFVDDARWNLRAFISFMTVRGVLRRFLENPEPRSLLSFVLTTETETFETFLTGQGLTSVTQKDILTEMGAVLPGIVKRTVEVSKYPQKIIPAAGAEEDEKDQAAQQWQERLKEISQSADESNLYERALHYSRRTSGRVLPQYDPASGKHSIYELPEAFDQYITPEWHLSNLGELLGALGLGTTEELFSLPAGYAYREITARIAELRQFIDQHPEWGVKDLEDLQQRLSVPWASLYQISLAGVQKRMDSAPGVEKVSIEDFVGNGRYAAGVPEGQRALAQTLLDNGKVTLAAGVITDTFQLVTDSDLVVAANRSLEESPIEGVGVIISGDLRTARSFQGEGLIIPSNAQGPFGRSGVSLRILDPISEQQMNALTPLAWIALSLNRNLTVDDLLNLQLHLLTSRDVEGRTIYAVFA